MKFAVLLVSLSDVPRVTTLTRAWVERACASVKRYFEDQSGGRVSPVFEVFDWYPLSLTYAEWMELGGNVSTVVNAEISKAKEIDFSGFDRFIYIQDSGTSNTGVSENDETRIEARDFDPALLAHELGHVYGPDDSFLNTPTGPARYDDLFCVMGREGAKYSFPDPALISPADGADASHADCGPGMCVPSLLATGWLEVDKHAAQVTGYTNAAPGSTLRIRALDGAPARNAVGLPSFCYVDDGDRYFVEYRVPRSRWDSGLPPSTLGWVVVHRTALGQPLMTLQVAAFQASPGQTLTIGGPANIYIFGGGPLRITVLGCDSATNSIDLGFYRQLGKPPQYIVPFEGFRQEPGALFWTPSAGWRAFPAGGAYAGVLEKLSQLEHTAVVARGAQRRHQTVLAATSRRQFHELRESLEEIRTAPAE
jgi:hypothetical protein